MAQLIHDRVFENEYDMSLCTHGKLGQILDPILQRKECNCRVEEPILVEHVIVNGLQILPGVQVKYQHLITGTCPDAAY